jgi:hypothetical protein
MRLRCQEGILAVVIKAPPGCVSNLGRIVQVSGPVKYFWYKNKSYPCWLIQPVTTTPYCIYQGGSYLSEIVTWDSDVFQPDEWLEPLLPLDIAAEWLLQTELTD